MSLRFRPMRMALALALTLTLVPLLLSTGACAPPTTIQTPQGKVAYRVDQVVTRLNELQNVAISANQQGQLSTDATRYIVQFVVTMDTTLAQAPTGWQSTLKTGWASLTQELPPIQNPAVVAALNAVQAIVQALP